MNIKELGLRVPRVTSRIRGLRLVPLLPVVLLVACATGRTESTREFTGCAAGEEFQAGGAIPTVQGRIPDRHLLFVDFQGLGMRTLVSEEEKALANDATYDPGDLVRVTIMHSEPFTEGDKKYEDQAGARVEQRMEEHINAERWTLYDDKNNKAVLSLDQKGGCKP